MKKIISAMAALAAVGVLFVGGAAQATLMIEISDGITTQTLVDRTDTLGADSDAREGILNATTTIGDFNFVVTLALSKPFVGSATKPQIDLIFGVTSFTTGGTLTIKFSDNDFATSGPSHTACRIGGVTSGSVSYSCFYDNGNTELATTTLISDVGSFGPGAFSGSSSAQIGATSPFSLTDVLTITHGAGFQLTTGNANARIPEPGSLALFGIGLLGLGFLARRRMARPLVD